MIEAQRLYHTCFHAAVAISQALIAVVAGVAERNSRARTPLEVPAILSSTLEMTSDGHAVIFHAPLGQF
jgi:hypothetical protein